MREDEILKIIIGAAIQMSNTLGPGLQESVYEKALSFDLRQHGLYVLQQVPMPSGYKGLKQEVEYRIDVLLNNKVLVEIKSIENLAQVHFAQTLTYLKLSGLELELLINFNAKLLKDRIHRLVNNLHGLLKFSRNGRKDPRIGTQGIGSKKHLF